MKHFYIPLLALLAILTGCSTLSSPCTCCKVESITASGKSFAELSGLESIAPASEQPTTSTD